MWMLVVVTIRVHVRVCDAPWQSLQRALDQQQAANRVVNDATTRADHAEMKAQQAMREVSSSCFCIEAEYAHARTHEQCAHSHEPPVLWLL